MGDAIKISCINAARNNSLCSGVVEARKEIDRLTKENKVVRQHRDWAVDNLKHMAICLLDSIALLDGQVSSATQKEMVSAKEMLQAYLDE